MTSPSDGMLLDGRARAAAQAGRFSEAAALFELAARMHRERDQPEAAFASLSNLAMMRKLGGDLHGALAALTDALAIEVPPDRRVLAVMTRASILDALDDLGAIAAWSEAVTLTTAPSAAAFCLAHAAGVLIKHGDPGAIAEVRKAIAHAGSATPSQLVGIIGAAGESAGRNGVALLAQAVLLLRRHMDAWNPSTSPFWDLLITRVGPATPLALSLCSFGLIATAMEKTSPAYPVLMSRVRAVLERCAAAREISIDQLLDRVQRDAAAVMEIEPALEGLVAADQRVI